MGQGNFDKDNHESGIRQYWRKKQRENVIKTDMTFSKEKAIRERHKNRNKTILKQKAARECHKNRNTTILKKKALKECHNHGIKTNL